MLKRKSFNPKGHKAKLDFVVSIKSVTLTPLNAASKVMFCFEKLSGSETVAKSEYHAINRGVTTTSLNINLPVLELSLFAKREGNRDTFGDKDACLRVFRMNKDKTVTEVGKVIIPLHIFATNSINGGTEASSDEIFGCELTRSLTATGTSVGSTGPEHITFIVNCTAKNADAIKIMTTLKSTVVLPPVQVSSGLMSHTNSSSGSGSGSGGGGGGTPGVINTNHSLPSDNDATLSGSGPVISSSGKAQTHSPIRRKSVAAKMVRSAGDKILFRLELHSVRTPPSPNNYYLGVIFEKGEEDVSSGNAITGNILVKKWLKNVNLGIKVDLQSTLYKSKTTGQYSDKGATVQLIKTQDGQGAIRMAKAQLPLHWFINNTLASASASPDGSGEFKLGSAAEITCSSTTAVGDIVLAYTLTAFPANAEARTSLAEMGSSLAYKYDNKYDNSNSNSEEGKVPPLSASFQPITPVSTISSPVPVPEVASASASASGTVLGVVSSTEVSEVTAPSPSSLSRIFGNVGTEQDAVPEPIITETEMKTATVSTVGSVAVATTTTTAPSAASTTKSPQVEEEADVLLDRQANEAHQAAVDKAVADSESFVYKDKGEKGFKQQNPLAMAAKMSGKSSIKTQQQQQKQQHNKEILSAPVGRISASTIQRKKSFVVQTSPVDLDAVSPPMPSPTPSPHSRTAAHSPRSLIIPPSPVASPTRVLPLDGFSTNTTTTTTADAAAVGPTFMSTNAIAVATANATSLLLPDLRFTVIHIDYPSQPLSRRVKIHKAFASMNGVKFQKLDDYSDFLAHFSAYEELINEVKGHCGDDARPDKIIPQFIKVVADASVMMLEHSKAGTASSADLCSACIELLSSIERDNKAADAENDCTVYIQVENYMYSAADSTIADVNGASDPPCLIVAYKPLAVDIDDDSSSIGGVGGWDRHGLIKQLTDVIMNYNSKLSTVASNNDTMANGGSDTGAASSILKLQPLPLNRSEVERSVIRASVFNRSILTQSFANVISYMNSCQDLYLEAEGQMHSKDDALSDLTTKMNEKETELVQQGENLGVVLRAAKTQEEEHNELVKRFTALQESHEAQQAALEQAGAHVQEIEEHTASVEQYHAEREAWYVQQLELQEEKHQHLKTSAGYDEHAHVLSTEEADALADVLEEVRTKAAALKEKEEQLCAVELELADRHKKYELQRKRSSSRNAYNSGSAAPSPFTPFERDVRSPTPSTIIGDILVGMKDKESLRTQEEMRKDSEISTLRKELDVSVGETRRLQRELSLMSQEKQKFQSEVLDLREETEEIRRSSHAQMAANLSLKRDIDAMQELFNATKQSWEIKMQDFVKYEQHYADCVYREFVEVATDTDVDHYEDMRRELEGSAVGRSRDRDRDRKNSGHTSRGPSPGHHDDSARATSVGLSRSKSVDRGRYPSSGHGFVYGQTQTPEEQHTALMREHDRRQRAELNKPTIDRHAAEQHPHVAVRDVHAHYLQHRDDHQHHEHHHHHHHSPDHHHQHHHHSHSVEQIDAQAKAQTQAQPQTTQSQQPQYAPSPYPVHRRAISTPRSGARRGDIGSQVRLEGATGSVGSVGVGDGDGVRARDETEVRGVRRHAPPIPSNSSLSSANYTPTGYDSSNNTEAVAAGERRPLDVEQSIDDFIRNSVSAKIQVPTQNLLGRRPGTAAGIITQKQPPPVVSVISTGNNRSSRSSSPHGSSPSNDFVGNVDGMGNMNQYMISPDLFPHQNQQLPHSPYMLLQDDRYMESSNNGWMSSADGGAAGGQQLQQQMNKQFPMNPLHASLKAAAANSNASGSSGGPTGFNNKVSRSWSANNRPKLQLSQRNLNVEQIADRLSKAPTKSYNNKLQEDLRERDREQQQQMYSRATTTTPVAISGGRRQTPGMKFVSTPRSGMDL